MTTEMLINELMDRGINIGANKYEEHHTKYKEIDGVDETILVTPQEHREIHGKLRKQGIRVPTEICTAAQRRRSVHRMTERKARDKIYANRIKRERGDYYKNNKKHELQLNKTYCAKYMYNFNFSELLSSEVIGKNRIQILFNERFTYNVKTNSFSVISYFSGMSYPETKYKLPVFDI